MILEKEKYEFLQYFYKSLKKHDVEILKHFNDSSISDNDYFSMELIAILFPTH